MYFFTRQHAKSWSAGAYKKNNVMYQGRTKTTFFLCGGKIVFLSGCRCQCQHVMPWYSQYHRYVESAASSSQSSAQQLPKTENTNNGKLSNNDDERVFAVSLFSRCQTRANRHILRRARSLLFWRLSDPLFLFSPTPSYSSTALSGSVLGHEYHTNCTGYHTAVMIS